MPSQRTPLVVDTDMGVDDWMALVYLLRHRQVQVRAITVVGNGLSPCDLGTKNAQSLVGLCGHPRIPVACGSTRPLNGKHRFPADWRITEHTSRTLLVARSLPSWPKTSAVALMTDVILRSEGNVTVLTLGPLTNLAHAITRRPEIIGRIEKVYMMGGAVRVPGNVALWGPGPAQENAEWNVYIDPRAASLVLSAGLPITLVPLDATNSVPVTEAFCRRAAAAAGNPWSRFLLEILESRATDIRNGTFFFWDSLAAAVLTDESIATIADMRIRVAEDEGSESGRTSEDETGTSVRVAIRADLQRFETLFLETLSA